MGMEWPVEGRAFMIEEVKKHERLQHLAHVRRAHQTRDWAVRPATGSLHERARNARRR
jgi:hypothetical protein